MAVDCKNTARSILVKVTPLMVATPGKLLSPRSAKSPPTFNVDPAAHGAGLQETLVRSTPKPGATPIPREMFGPEALIETSLRATVIEPDVSVNVSAFAEL